MESTWPGFEDISYLFVFGSSHSRAGQGWVEDLVQKKRGKPLQVHNYANEQCTIHSVQLQVQRFAQQQPDLAVPEVNKYSIGGKNLFNAVAFMRPSILPRKYATSIFAVWAELADENANIDAKSAANSLFKNALSALYGIGARHFLIYTNPPRAPPSGVNQAASQAHSKFERNTESWREALQAEIKDFKTWYTGVTIVLIDAWQILKDVNEKPEEFGFTAADVSRASGGRIWMDSTQFKSNIHELIAEKTVALLSQV